MKSQSKPASTSYSLENKTREQINLLFHNNPLPLWVYDVETLRFLDVNPAAVKQYGYTRAEFLRMHVSDIIDGGDPPRQKTKPQVRKRSSVQVTGKVRHYRKDGSIIHVKITSRKLIYKGHKAALVAVNDITEKKEAEEALRQSENTYRDLIEHTPLLICTHDLQGNLLSINPWVTKVMGYDSKTMVGRNIRSFLAPETRTNFKKYMAKIRKYGAAQGLMQVITASGDRRFWEYYGTLRTEGLAKPIVRGTAFDITERKAAEEALSRSEAMYRGLFDSVLDGIFRSTPDGRFISANPALVHMLGYETEDDLLSINIKNLYLDPQVWDRNIQKSKETDELRNIEIKLKRRDGKLITALENSHAVRDSKGRIVLYEGTLTDITERKRVEEALQASEIELRALFEAIPDLVLVVDKDGRYLKIAPTNLSSVYLHSEDMLGRRMHEIFSRQKADEFVGHIRKALRTHKPVQFEYAQLIGDRIMWFSGAAIPLTKNTVVWVARDITPQKLAEEQVQRRLAGLETLYESGLVLSQTLYPSQIGQKIIRVLSERLDWHHAAVRVRRGDGDEVELLAFSETEDRGDQPGVAESRARNAITKIGEGMAGWVMEHGQLINSGSLQDDPRYHETFPNMLSGLYIPILAGGRVLGCISVETDQHDAFTAADELLLTTLASQAAVALENARLFAEIQQRAAESNALYETTRDLTAQTDLSTLLKTISKRVAALLNIPGGGVYLYDPEKNDLEIVTATPDSLPVGTRLKMGEGMAGRVAEKREALIVDDYQSWEGRSSQYADQTFGAALEVPMLYRGELIGVIAVYDMHSPEDEDLSANKKNRKFTEGDQRLLSLYAASAAGAIYSARLFDMERLRREDAETLRQIAVRSAERLSVLHAATREIAGIGPELEQVYASIHLAASRLMPTEAFTIVLVNKEHNELDGVYLFDRDGRSPFMSLPFGQGFSSRVISSGETILLNDVDADNIKVVHFGTPEHARSVLAVPLRVGEHVIGAISTQSYQPDVFQDDDRVLLEMLAAQAAIAIENARLFDQTRRRLNELESLTTVGKALTGTLELHPLLENILRAACQAIPAAEKGTILLGEENEQGHLRVRTQMGYTDARLMELTFDDRKGYSGRAFHEKRPILIRDALAEYEIPFDQKLEEVNTVQSAIVAPLIVKDEAIGAISLDNTSRKSAFDEDDLNLLVLFASSAAVVIESARLFGETRRRADEFEMLYEVTRDIGSHQQDLSLLLPTLGERAAHLLGAYGGAFYLYDASRNDLELNVVYPIQYGLDERIKLGEGAAGHVAQTREPLVLDDYGTWAGHRPGLEGFAYHALLQIPVIYGGELIGVLEVYERGDSRRTFSEADEKLLSLLAAHIAGVIHNTRLFDAARETADEFANLYEIAHDLSGQHDLDDLLNLIVERAGLLLNAPVSGIYLYDEATNDLYVAVNRGLTSSLGIRLAMGEGVAGRVAQSGQPMIVDDYRCWEGRSPKYEDVPLRSMLGVPMLYSGELIGVLTVDEIGDSERKFTQEDVGLLSLFAPQAAAAVYSTRLFEKASQRAGEFEALYQTAADLSSQSDLPTLLNTIIQRAWVLTGTAGAGLYLFDREHGDLELVAIHDPDIRPGLRLELGEGVAGKVARTRQPLMINNYQAWNDRSPKYEGVPYTSVIGVPMLYSGELIGVLDVFNRTDKNISGRPREFTDQDTNLISLLANSAAGAVYGARLLDQARRRVEELNAIAQVSSALRVASTRADMMPIILAQLREILHADGAMFGGLDPATQDIVIELAQGSLESFTGFTVPAGEGVSAQVIQSRQVYSTHNLQDDSHVFSPHLLKNVRSAAIIPLVSQDHALGVLWITRDEKNGTQPPAFDGRELRILSAIGDITANAIQRVSLYEETTHYAKQLEIVNAMGNALSETLDLSGVYEKTARSALDLLPDTAMVAISLFDPQTKLITTAYGLQDGELLNVADLPSVLLDESGKDNQSEAILGARSLIVSDLNESLKNMQMAEEKNGVVEVGRHLPLQSALYVPMKAEGRVIGVLQLQSYTKKRYSSGDAELMELAINTVAGSIQNTRLFSQLKRRVDQLSALHAVDTAIGSTTDLRVSLQSVLENITRHLRVDAADVLLLNSSTLILQYASGIGFLTSDIMHTSLSIGRGPAGKAALDRRMVYVPDLNAEEDGYLRSNLITSEKFVAFLAVPLMAKGEVKGVLEIFNRSPLDMDDERKSFLEMLAGQAALAIDNALMFESLEKANIELVIAYDATIEGWSQALELRDQETQGHSARVLDLTMRLASTMDLSDKETQDIRRGVLLHDIGKMGIPDAILHKPGPLTDDEWEIMRRHPQYAYDMLAPIVYLRNSLNIPYCHHEKWDGTGYPRRLKGETIPLSARIFSVVDVYDALTSNRPYREAWSQEKTIEYITEQSGIYFDPHVVDVFLKLITT